MAEDRNQLNIRVDEDTLTRLRMIAVVDGSNISELVRRSIDEMIERHIADKDFQGRREAWVASLQQLGNGADAPEN